MSLTGTGPNGESTVLNIWNHGLKVFNLCEGLPIVSMTAGMAHFGPISVSNMTKDLRQQLSKNEDSLDPNQYTIEDVAEKADDFFFEQYNQIQPPPADPHPFEFWIGGYGSAASHGEIWKIEIRDGNKVGKTQLVKAEDDSFVIWGGQLEPISRLILGISPSVHQHLLNLDISEDAINDIRNQIQTPLVNSAMPVQDAIDLADFLVDTTKRYFAFHYGATVVGGETDIATVTKHEGFKWIRRKHYYPKHLNRRDNDHV